MEHVATFWTHGVSYSAQHIPAGCFSLSPVYVAQWEQHSPALGYRAGWEAIHIESTPAPPPLCKCLYLELQNTLYIFGTQRCLLQKHKVE